MKIVDTFIGFGDNYGYVKLHLTENGNYYLDVPGGMSTYTIFKRLTKDEFHEFIKEADV